MEYRSKTQFSILTDTAENTDALQAWGYSAPMGPTGLTVVFDETNQMVSGVMSVDDFNNSYEEIPAS
jgi:hypothetical protein